MSSRVEEDSGSDSDTGVRYVCLKCPVRVDFKTNEELKAHKKGVHPKEKSRKQALEEEEEEERSVIAGNSRGKRRSQRNVEGSKRSDSNVSNNGSNDIAASEEGSVANVDDSENTVDIPDVPEVQRSPARKRGKPASAAARASPRGGKRIAGPARMSPRTSTPAELNFNNPRGGKRRPGPKSITKTRPPWMDLNIFKEKFPGG